MSTTRGIRVLAGTALACSVILLGGCSSSGTTPAAATGGASPLTGGLTSHTTASSGDSSTGGSSSSSSDDSSSSSSSSDDSSTGGSTGGLGGSDPGCKAAMSAAENAMSELNMSDPNSAKDSLNKLAGKMHAAAGQSKNPAAAAAINKVGDDYAKLANALSGGGTPDTSSITSDATAMGTACAG